MKAGWEFRPLGELCEILDYLRKPITKKDRQPGEYPYYGATGILDYVEGYLFDERLVLIGEDGPKWQSGERTAFSAEGKYWVNNHAHVVRPTKGRLLEDWLIYYLTHSDLSPFVSGLTVPKLNQGNLREIPIPVPSFAEQQRIVAILDEAFEGIATAKANAEKNLQNAHELFNRCLDASLQRHGEGFIETSLGDEVDLQPGYAFPSGGYTTQEPSVRLLRGDNIMQGYFRWDDVKRWPSNQTGAYAKFELREGDVVLAMDRPWVKAGLKRAQICKEDMPCLQVQRTARLRCRSTLRQDFLYHLTGSLKFSSHLLGVQTGLGVPHISGQQIESFKFMRPTLAQQESIAESLNQLSDNVQALAEILEKKTLAIDELKQSLLHRAFNGDL